MPRKPRNPGTGKAPVNTPAQGAGWGGEAKGASTAPESIQTAPQLAAGNPGDPSNWPMTERRALRVAQHEEHMDLLHLAALGKKRIEPVQVKAMEVFRDSTLGPPRQTIKTYTGSLDDLPDDELDAELARQRQKAAATPGA